MQSITGRDGHIMKKALAYAIVAIGALPSERQEEGDRRDMLRLLEWMANSPDDLAWEITNAHQHLTGEGHPANRSNTDD